MGFALTGGGLGEACEEPPGVGGNPQQEGGLHQGVVVVAREQDRVPALGLDLDRLAVVVHLLDEAEQVLPSLACSDRHRHSSIDWYRVGTRYGTIFGRRHSPRTATAAWPSRPSWGRATTPPPPRTPAGRRRSCLLRMTAV